MLVQVSKTRSLRRWARLLLTEWKQSKAEEELIYINIHRQFKWFAINLADNLLDYSLEGHRKLMRGWDRCKFVGGRKRGRKKFARIYRWFKFIANYYKTPQPPVAAQRTRGTCQIIIGSAFFIVKVEQIHNMDHMSRLINDQIHLSRLRPDQCWLVWETLLLCWWLKVVSQRHREIFRIKDYKSLDQILVRWTMFNLDSQVVLGGQRYL